MDQKELMAALAVAAETPVSYVDLSRNTQRIKVDMDTRKITGHKEFGVIKDHLAEDIIFEVGRYKGSTDLAEKNCAIHWENGENGGVLPVTEIDLSEDGLILMRWELSDEFTQHAGDIAYALHFFSILDNGFTYHAATNAAAGRLGTTLNASAHSLNKVTPSEIEVYIAKMNALSAEIDSKIKSLELELLVTDDGNGNVTMKQVQGMGNEISSYSFGEGIIYDPEKKEVSVDLDNMVTPPKADAIIVEKSGTTIVATDSSDAGFEGMKLFGWGKQEKTLGNQLWNGKYMTTALNAEYAEFTYGTTIAGNMAMPITVGKTYTFSINGVPTEIRYIFIDADGADIGSLTNAITTVPAPDNAVYLRWRASTDNGYHEESDKCMLNEGSTALPWEPYTGGQASPNPEYKQPIVSAGQELDADGNVVDVGIDVPIKGKNLLNCSGLVERTIGGITFTPVYDANSNLLYIEANGTDSAGAEYVLTGKYGLDIGNNYILSGCPSSGSSTTYRMKITDSNYVYNNYDEGSGVSFIEKTGTARISILIYGGYTADHLRFYPMIRLASLEDDTYEPYTEQTIHISKAFPGIEVTDASLATYTDADGKMRCADYRDYARGVDVQRVNRIRISGDWNWRMHGAGIGYYTYQSVGQADLPDGTHGVFTHFLTGNFSNDKRAFVGTIGSPNIQIRYDAMQDANALKAWLNENEVYCDYILATPIETPIPDAEMAEWRALHTNKPTTVITNDAGCHMKVEYVADTKNYIDGRIGEGGEEETPPVSLPEVTADDNGKILQVVDGELVLVEMENSSVKTYIDDYINEALGGEY